MNRLAALTTLIAIASSSVLPASAADVYRWVDQNGNVTYADRPQPPSDASSARAAGTSIDELLELSGLRVQLASITVRIADEFRPGKGQMRPSDQAIIDRVIREIFRSETMYTSVRNELDRRIDPIKIETAAAWFRSPLGRQIIALEVASSRTADSKILEYGKSVRNNPAAAKRAALIDRLDEVTGSSELTLDIGAAVIRATQKAVSDASEPARKLTRDQIARLTSDARLRSRDTVRAQVTAAMLYSYRTLDDRDLEAYVQFASSEAGRWYTDASRKALLQAVDAMVDRGAVELVRAVPLERWRLARSPTPPR